MFICKHTRDLHRWFSRNRSDQAVTGFVPTMGALHEGHLSLIAESRARCNLTIVSVFVNPRQFNDARDLEAYPRPVSSDIEKVFGAQTDVLFMPEVEDVYPDPDPFPLHFDPGYLDTLMEGAFRPGHFKGVGDVVYRLLSMTEPNKLFLGQKDFQQIAVIRKLIEDTHLPVEIVPCPIIREPNGLAMSSRNMRLSDVGRERAGSIYAELISAKEKFERDVPIEKIKSSAMDHWHALGFKPEYFECIDGRTLQPVLHREEAEYIVACCAVSVDGVRLIDNIVLQSI